MTWLDLVSTYLYGWSLVVVVVALLMLVSGLDDLFIDLAYWSRRVWRAWTVYRHRPPPDPRVLQEAEEQPLAIMVPAWQETGVIGPMAALAATTLDYENYHIFVGTYPNDAATQHDVDAVCARFPNVHKVVCARPGPTSKADCLNNVLDAILRFESKARFAFAGFVLHDAEDVIAPMELRLFNSLVGRKDLIQIPVYPFERPWTHFTSLHYLDEFAELHGKDVPVREALAGQVPSAGVGTCFSRRAMLALIEDGRGIAFDVQSLTEDYDIGLRLRLRGMREVFVRYPGVASGPRPSRFGARPRTSGTVCVREYFPDRLRTAVRQKSRWIIGIVYQGYRTHGWTGRFVLDYFLWRDRKGAWNNFVSFAAMLILFQLVALWIAQALWPGTPRFLSIYTGGTAFHVLLMVNLGLMANRMVQRVIFVSGYYGIVQGLMSVPRLLWGNLVNFLANGRAIHQIVRTGDPRRVAWDKTTHDFPHLDDAAGGPLAVEDLLRTQGLLDDEALVLASRNRIQGLSLERSLIHGGWLRPEQLARTMAEQFGVGCESVDAREIAADLIARVPARLALRHAVLPLREERGALVLASESYLDPVALSALARQLGTPVRYVLAHKGQVTVGLRRWYVQDRTVDAAEVLRRAVRAGRIDAGQEDALWQRFVSRQVLLGEVLVAQGRLDHATLRVLLMQHARSPLRLGDFLVEKGVIGVAELRRALVRQASLQPRIERLLASIQPRRRSRTARAPA